MQGVGGFDRNGIGARQAAEQWLRLAGQYGPHAKAWSEAVWSARGIEGVRSLMGLTGLGRNHSSKAIDQACARALNLSAHRLSDIQSILKQGAATPCQELLPWPAEPSPDDPATTIPSTQTSSKMNPSNSSALTQPNVIRDLQTYSQFIHATATAGAP